MFYFISYVFIIKHFQLTSVSQFHPFFQCVCTLEKVYTALVGNRWTGFIRSHLYIFIILSWGYWGEGGQPRRPWIYISIYIGNTSIYLYFYLVDSICCRHSQNILKFIVYRWVKKATRDREHGSSLALSNPKKMSHSFVGTSTGVNLKKNHNII